MYPKELHNKKEITESLERLKNQREQAKIDGDTVKYRQLDAIIKLCEQRLNEKKRLFL